MLLLWSCSDPNVVFLSMYILGLAAAVVVDLLLTEFVIRLLEFEEEEDFEDLEEKVL